MAEIVSTDFSSFATDLLTNARALVIAEDANILYFSAIAVTLGLLTAKIASKKDGGFFKWFIAGAFLGIIALPVAIFKKQHVPLTALKKCPKCDDQLPLPALVCDACDYNFISGIAGHRRQMLPSPN
ncbi:MAG: hypothetical protein ACREQ2_19730 [Candidatus Binatia bacterium]